MSNRSNLMLVFFVSLLNIYVVSATTVNIIATDYGRVYEGIGAVSAGGNSRLLIDYPEPYRSDILDFLFKPKFGAGFQHLKVEIGCGTNSTSGAEPSHAVTKAELANPVCRGYEFWLMKEARNRNPNVILDCLPWGFTYWQSGIFSQDSADYFTAFLKAARDQWGLELDWLGGTQNERGGGTDLWWLRYRLRPTMDAAGFSSVDIQAPEGQNSGAWGILTTLAGNSEYNNAVKAVSYHYVDGYWPTVSQIAMNKLLWDGEDSVSGGGWSNGQEIVARMNRLYISGKITKQLIWCPIDSCADGVLLGGVGAMAADKPWSGYYTIRPAIWAIAHYTQFAEPGWVFLDSGCGLLSGNGSYVTLRNPATSDYSIIIYSQNAEDITFNLFGGLPNSTLHVWKSTSSSQFEYAGDITPVGGSFSGHCDADTLYSITTTTGQQKGQPAHAIPPKIAFPFPYSEDFENYAVGVTPKYFSDMQGTFEIAACKAGRAGKCLMQVVPQVGYTWGYDWCNPTATMTIIPDDTQRDNYELSSDVYIDGGEIYLGVRKGSTQKFCGYAFVLQKDGNWRLCFDDTQSAAAVLNRGQVAGFNGSQWHHVAVRCSGSRIDAYVDHVRCCTITDSRRMTGQPCIGGSFNLNQYDTISVAPVGPVWNGINQSDSSVIYTGTWWYYAGSWYLNGDCKYTNLSNASATYPFYGRFGQVIGTFRSDCGLMDVYVDNVFQVTMDCYNTSQINQQMLYQTPQLSLGNHTIKVVVKGQKNPSATNSTIIVEGFASTTSPACTPPGVNLAQSATASASSYYQNDATWAADKANDGNYNTRWNSNTTNNSWLELNFGQTVTFSSTRITESYNRITGYKIQYYDGQWKDAFAGTAIGGSKTDVFAPATGTKARLYITSAAIVPSVWEFEVYSQAGDADITTDGKIDMQDITAMAQQWLKQDCSFCCDCYGADVFHDGAMTLSDFAMAADGYNL